MDQLDTDQDFGPAMRGRASPFTRRPLESPPGPGRATGGSGRRGGGRRGLRVTLRVAVVALLVVVLTGVGLLGYVSARMDRHEVAGLQGSRPRNILITGTPGGHVPRAAERAPAPRAAT